MSNKEFAKLFLRDNGLKEEEKIKHVETILSRELTETLRKNHDHERLQFFAHTPHAMNDWVEKRFRELTNKLPNNFQFLIKSARDFPQIGYNFFVEIKMKNKPPYRTEVRGGRGNNLFSTVSTTAPLDASAGHIWFNPTDNTRFAMAQNGAWEIQQEATPSVSLTQDGLYADGINISMDGITYYGATVTDYGERFSTDSQRERRTVQPITTRESFGPMMYGVGVGSSPVVGYVRPADASAIRAGTIDSSRIAVHYTATGGTTSEE